MAQGLLQNYGLDGWWNAALTASQRDRIESLFHPLGSPHPRPLTVGAVGHIIGATSTPLGFLSQLVGWLRSTPDHLAIRRKLRDKMTELVIDEPNVVSRHFSLQVLISEYYRDRSSDPNALTAVIGVCRAQIAIAPSVAVAMHRDFSRGLPTHAGYSQLAVIFEKAKNYDEAITVCEEAKRAHWNGTPSCNEVGSA